MARRTYQPQHARKPQETAPVSPAAPRAERVAAPPAATTQTPPSVAGSPPEATAARGATPAGATGGPDAGRAAPRLGRRGRKVVTDPGLYPAREATPNPRWWERVRGLVGASVLVSLGGILVAAAIGIVLVLLIIAAVATLA